MKSLRGSLSFWSVFFLGLVLVVDLVFGGGKL